jgi:hypothetical protein
MSPLVKNILAVVVGLLVGGLVNFALIMASGSIIPLPEGIDPMDPESLKANIDLLESKHFIMPFIAHALGTLVAAFIITKMAVSNHRRLALFGGLFFLLGGIMSVLQIPAPMWFKGLDLLVAYLPMALLGWMLAKPKTA